MTRVRATLRLAAVTIATLGAIDPRSSRATDVAPALHLIAMSEPVLATAQTLAHRFGDRFATHITLYQPAARTAACPAHGGCVLVSQGEVPGRVTGGAALLGAVRVPRADPLIIERVAAPALAHLQARATLSLQLFQGAKQVAVYDQAVLVGHRAAVEAGEVALTWLPLGTGPRALRVIADDDVIDVGAQVTDSPAKVFFYEPEVTWGGTFVRRALSGDARFELSSRAQIAPAIAVGRGDGSVLAEAMLPTVEVVVVTAPEALKASDALLLERFIRRRGGTLIVLPDRPSLGPLQRLMPPAKKARQEMKPLALGPLRASELLLFQSASDVFTMTALDDTTDGVVVERPIGRGRMIVSGALDAWRYRAATRHDEYWTALIWNAAVAAGPALRVTASPVLGRPGEDFTVAAELQALGDQPDRVSAVASTQCGDDQRMLRLWPTAQPGRMVGTFRPEGAGRCRVQVSFGDLSGSSEVLVRPDVTPPRVIPNHLEAVVAAHDGVVVTPGAEQPLFDRAAERLPPTREARPNYPMQSGWWLVPFVGCLAIEWLLRRRHGLK